MKLCKDCKHCFVEFGSVVCKQRISHFDYINGEHTHTLCEVMRKSSHLCGPEASQFEPKNSEPRKRWSVNQGFWHP